jgi:glutathione synthase/RimK-type ligase-like ATP-grasp enzyme
MHIALATAAHLPGGSDDDQVLIDAMRTRGITVTPAIWDQPADWDRFDAVLIRSVWDYHLKFPRFLEWLDILEATGVRVQNTVDVVRWNADKKYMLELERRGVRITPTRVVRADDDVSLERVMRDAGWREAVVKPAVSSTGYETWFVTAPCSANDEARFAKQRAAMDVLVQEFASGVRTGEMSFVFLSGQYSHCVLKRAAGTEFRIHVEHGGSVESYQPAPVEIKWAESVMASVSEPWTYARVDAVNNPGGLLLMELELLDPELFFKYRPASATLLITALEQTAIRAR